MNRQLFVLLFVTAIVLEKTVAGRKIPTLLEIGNRLKKLERVIGIAAISAKGCPPSFRRFQSSCYHFGVSSLTWGMAKIACQQMGAKLASVETYPEEEFILRNLKLLPNLPNYIGFYIGGNNFVGNGHWVWDSTGKPIGSYRPWGAGQPQTKKGECLGYLPKDSWRWHDFNCNGHNKFGREGFGFVCEKPIAN